MARDDERPQFNPKHRIAGAIILVSLAVIFVPMLLDDTSPPPQDPTLTDIPSPDEGETRVVVSPVPPPEPADRTPVDSAPVPEPVPVEKPAAPVVKPAAPASEPAPKPAAAPVVLAAGWIVQVGTFSNIDNAEQLRARLKAAGFAVHAESIQLSGKKALRLRVGPYVDKETAARAQTRIEKDFGVRGLVRSYP